VIYPVIYDPWDGEYGEIATQAEKGSRKSEKGSPKRRRIPYQIDTAVLGSRTESLGLIGAAGGLIDCSSAHLLSAQAQFVSQKHD
jgi:hypothetical protein